MVVTSTTKTIECPYCGNNIIAQIPLNSTKLSLSFGLSTQVINSNINIILSGDKKLTTIASYNVSCDFCGRKYVY